MIADNVNYYYGGDYNKFTPYVGDAAPGFNSMGGATQIELPISADLLEELGLLKKNM